MSHSRGRREAQWYREGNAARFYPGAGCRVWLFAAPDGHCIVIIPAEFGWDERERLFESLLWQYWYRRYGLPEARARLRALVRRRDDVA